MPLRAGFDRLETVGDLDEGQFYRAMGMEPSQRERTDVRSTLLWGTCGAPPKQ